MLCFTLEIWGFTSDWHLLFQILNSSPEWRLFEICMYFEIIVKCYEIKYIVQYLVNLSFQIQQRSTKSFIVTKSLNCFITNFFNFFHHWKTKSFLPGINFMFWTLVKVLICIHFKGGLCSEGIFIFCQIILRISRNLLETMLIISITSLPS